MYGAELIAALRPALEPARVDFFGVGGEKMRAAGCDLVVDARDLAVVGITEILSHLPRIWQRFHRLISEARRRRPDLAIVIDSPAFNWRVARQMKKNGVPVVYYVCPQFWAWRQGRVRLLRQYVDLALVIFPFEEEFYARRGVKTRFVGHPLAELRRPQVSRAQYAREHGLDPAKNWIALMPGSRVKEVAMNLPGMIASSNLLGKAFEFLLPVAPSLDRKLIDDCIARTSRQSGPRIHLLGEALPVLAHARAGIIASGTATVEAAMMETPLVMVYRVTPATYWLGRYTVRVPHFAMVNLIAGKRVVPELVQQQFTAEKVVSELSKVIPDGAAREHMLEGLRRVKNLLQGGQRSELGPVGRAARAIIELLGGRETGSVRGSEDQPNGS
jgi:lipid-A-disaccharide synthase